MLPKSGLMLESTRHLLFCFLDKMRMIYSSFGQQNKITLTDLMFQIKGHGGISVILPLFEKDLTSNQFR